MFTSNNSSSRSRLKLGSVKLILPILMLLVIVLLLSELGIMENILFPNKVPQNTVNISGTLMLFDDEGLGDNECGFTPFVDEYQIQIPEGECNVYKELFYEDVKIIGELEVESEEEDDKKLKKIIYPIKIKEIYIEKCDLKKDTELYESSTSCKSHSDCGWFAEKECRGCWNNTVDKKNTEAENYCACVEGKCQHPDKSWVESNASDALEVCVNQIDRDRCLHEQALITSDIELCKDIAIQEKKRECLDYFTN